MFHVWSGVGGATCVGRITVILGGKTRFWADYSKKTRFLADESYLAQWFTGFWPDLKALKGLIPRDDIPGRSDTEE